ncbi:hypothetical protein GCM10027081_48090 [Cupriavidus yeoncheonensis]
MLRCEKVTSYVGAAVHRVPGAGTHSRAVPIAGCKQEGPAYTQGASTGCSHGADNKVPVLASYSDTESLLAVSIAVIVVTARIPSNLRVVRWGVRVMGGVMGSLLDKK